MTRKQRIPVWGKKVKLLSQRDLDEIEKFREFLGDLHSDMHPTTFGKKWHDYMEVTPMAAEAWVKARLRPRIA